MKFYFFLISIFLASTITQANYSTVATRPRTVYSGELFSVQKLGRRTYALLNASGATNKLGCQTGVIALEEGLVLIDTHLTSSAEKQVMDVLKKVIDKPVIAVFNTHGHDDHIGGNSVHASTAEMYAHKNTVAHIRKLGKTAPKKHGIAPEPLTPKIKALFAAQGVKVIEIGEGHSDGDLVVHDEEDQVLFVGDLFVNGYIGYLGEGFFRPWVNALAKLAKLDIQHVATGHGPLGTTEDLLTFRQYIIDFVKSARLHFEENGSVKGYSLPPEYKNLGAQFYLPDNIARAFELWKKGELESFK